MRRPLALALIAGLSMAAGMARPGAADQGTITVFAAASLKEAFTAMAPAFTKKTGTSVTFNFGGSDTLATQIKQGAPADVFASANAAQMQVVSDAGLIVPPPRTFARNRLVVVVPKANPAGISGPSGLAKPGAHIVLAAATVPVGSYARATFAKLAGTNGYPGDFPAAVEKNVVSNELDVKAVVTKVALGEADAGVVYSTDVTPDLAAKLTMLPFPPSATSDIEYPIAALKNTGNAAGAKAFVDFVLGAGQADLKARGFIAP